jgi:hypothetical protein
MASEVQQKFADELRFQRESKNITLQQIASKTRIDLKFLQAIEDANFELLPEIYIRAFIKEYAQTVDLNPIEVLRKYDEARSGRTEEKTKTDEIHGENRPEIIAEEAAPAVEQAAASKRFGTTEIEPAPVHLSPAKASNNMNFKYIIGAGILLAAAVIIYFVFFTGSPEIIREASISDTTDSNGERFEIKKYTPEDSVAAEGAVIPQSKDSLYISIITTERVWVKVTADGKLLNQKMEDTGAKLNFAAKKSFSVSVGNAGRVKVFLNNKPVENIGKPGEIRNLYITADGIKYYTIQPQKNEKKSPTKN